MTVKELREILEIYKDDAEVMIECEGIGHCAINKVSIARKYPGEEQSERIIELSQ